MKMRKKYTLKNNKIIVFLILHIFLLVTSFFGIASKLAAQEEFLSAKFLLYYAIVLLNLFVYAIVWQQLIKHMPLTTAYANKAVSVIWGVVWGCLFFKETITIKKVIAIIIIITGIILVVTEKEAVDD